MSELVAEKLRLDPRINQAKKLLLDAVADQQHGITGIRPPQKDLRLHYDEILAAYAELRGGKLWFPYLGSGFGKGALVELLDGSIKYDFICGIGPHFFGHSNPLLIDACIDAALSDTVMQGHLQQNKDSVELCTLLAEVSGLPHCFLSTSGVMANENALKIAFQKKFPAKRILAFERCFTGRSLTMSQITDKPAFRDGLPSNLFVDYVPFYDAKKPEESTQKALAVLKQHIKRYPKDHAAMILELVQGEAGFYFGTHEFFAALMEVLKEHSIAVFVDEIQSFGRTSELFAYQHFGLEKYVDICSIGKISQVCATLFTNEFLPRAGLLSQTFTGSTSSIRASKVIIQTLVGGGFYGKEGINVKIESHFAKNLKGIAERNPNLLQGPFGIGSMIAFTPYDGDAEVVTRFVHTLFEAGVIAFVAGASPTRVRFLPPGGALKSEDIDQACKVLEETLLK